MRRVKVRLLSDADVEAAISMAEAIEVVAGAYAAASAGEVRMPQRSVLSPPAGTTLVMPAYLPGQEALALKVVSVFKHNASLRLPTVHAAVLLIDPASGRPQALMNGARLTALRTGAGSGVAIRLLAREDAEILALFGAGGQAAAQVEGALQVRQIREVRIFTPSGTSARALAQRLAAKFPALRCRPAATPEQAIRGAAIISCATTSLVPVFAAAKVAPGTHINGTGSFTPAMREVPLQDFSPAPRVFVDYRAAVLEEAGEVIEAIAAGTLRAEQLTEIGAVVRGDAPGRTSGAEITVFKSVGIAAQDAAMARAIYERALDSGLGREVAL